MQDRNMVDYRKPVYLLAGGRASSRELQRILLQVVFQASGVTSPKIGYIGVANDDDREFFQRTLAIFKDAGAGNIRHVIVTPKKSNLQEAQDTLISSDIIYIAGGDVERGMQLLRDRNLALFLSNLHEGGKLFFGMSAGSIMLAKEWVRWRNPDDDSTVELFSCLGFAPVICDAHDELDGWQELQTALKLETEGSKGYGIVSGAGIRVSPQGEVIALGSAIHQFVRKGKKIERLNDILP